MIRGFISLFGAFVWLATLSGWLVGSPEAVGAPLKLVSADLRSFEAAGHPANRWVGPAAEALRQTNPDIVVLQNVPDWSACNQLVVALRPAEYHILICTAFRDAAGAPLAGRQLAVLSKQKGYFSWAETWPGASSNDFRGGYAFAAVQFGQHRAGFFSTVLTSRGGSAQDASLASAGAQTLLDQVNSVRKWEANRVDTFVVAGSVHGTGGPSWFQRTAGKLLSAEGFGTLLPKTDGSSSSALALLAIDPAGLGSEPDIAMIPGLDIPMVSCSFDPARASEQRQNVAAAKLAPPPVQEAQVPPPVPHDQASSPLWPYLVLLGIPAFLAGVLVLWIATRLRRRWSRHDTAALSPAVHPAVNESHYRVVTPSSVTASDPSAGTAGALHFELPAAAPTQTHAAMVNLSQPIVSPDIEGAPGPFGPGLAAHLRRWLKQKLLRQLIVDRSSLIEAQRTATLQTLHVEERLGRIERQMQEQNQIYQQRIDELGRELAAAREENRELIRARIAQIKAEMELARARFELQRQQASAGLSASGEKG